jgi:hypothetical protein
LVEQSHAVVNYSFREQNVVSKFVFSKKGKKNANKSELNLMFNKVRLSAYRHAATTRLLVEQNSITEPNPKGFLSRFF